MTVKAAGGKDVQKLAVAGQAAPQVRVLRDAIEATRSPAQALGGIAPDLRRCHRGIARCRRAAQVGLNLGQHQVQKAVVVVGATVLVDVRVARHHQRMSGAYELHEARSPALLVVPLRLLDARGQLRVRLFLAHARQHRDKAVEPLGVGDLAALRVGAKVGRVPRRVDVRIGKHLGDGKARGQARALAVHHQLVASLLDRRGAGLHVKAAKLRVTVDKDAHKAGLGHLGVLIAGRGASGKQLNRLTRRTFLRRLQDLVAARCRLGREDAAGQGDLFPTVFFDQDFALTLVKIPG